MVGSVGELGRAKMGLRMFSVLELFGLVLRIEGGEREALRRLGKEGEVGVNFRVERRWGLFKNAKKMPVSRMVSVSRSQHQEFSKKTCPPLQEKVYLPLIASNPKHLSTVYMATTLVSDPMIADLTKVAQSTF